MKARSIASLLVLIATLLAIGSLALAWQEHSKPPAQTEQKQESAPAQGENAADHTAAQPGTEQLTHASQEAAGQHEEAAHDEHAEFKQSASVKALGRLLGLSPNAAYWFSIVLNFVVIALLIFLLLKAKVPALFRDRTAAVQRQIEEARRASEEATRRLSEIEGRLARLDSEIAGLQVATEADARAEEQRILGTAEEDKQKIVQGAEQEIVAAARLARSELKAYVAELAVSLAERRIQVTPATDQDLVRAFVDELGKDGR
jgi:F-type H+-transporting ATPase subunit b